MYCLELGGEDDAFAALEARAAADGVSVDAPGVATADDCAPDRVRDLAYTRVASELLARTNATVAAAAQTLRSPTLDAAGPVAVRARDVRGTAGVATPDAERALGAVLVDRGYDVDLDAPASVLRAIFAGDVCLLGWTVATSDRGYGDRRPTDRPFFHPGGMAPLDARALVNVAGAGPNTTVLDPMCGTAGLPIEAALVGGDVLALDAQARMVSGARANLRAYAPAERFAVGRADATALPIAANSVDAVVFDAPYGRQSKVVGDLEDLLAGALAEARRVAPRAVVVADRPWREAARATGWRVETIHERRVHRSLTRHVHVLGR